VKLEHDAQGFLTGTPLGDDGAARMLAGIKGDTSKILALMRRTAGRAAQGGSYGGASARNTRGPLAPAAVPSGRAGAAAARMRGTDGRFVAGASAPNAQAERRAAETADAAQSMARTVEAQRRDAKADRAAQARGSDGRFGAGGRGGGGGNGVGGALAASGAALQGAEQIDPLLGAIGEIRGVYAGARGVASPLGRAGAGLFGMGRGQSGGEAPVGWLRKLWRELRASRKDDAKANRDLLRGIKGVRGGSGPGEGGGFLSTLAGLLPALASAIPGLSMLPKILAPLLAGAGGAAAAAGAGAKGLLKGALKRVPLIGPLIEAITGVVEDQRIAADDTLSDEQKRRQRIENAGGTGGAMAGALGGAAAGSLLGPIGTVGGAIIGGLAGSSAGKKIAGWVSGMFESGAKGAATISTGKGDFGGKSYGKHQLSSNSGTLSAFLRSSEYGSEFAGMKPGSKEFDAKWKALAADPKFAQAQQDFMTRTHFDPQMRRLKGAGIDLSGRGEAVSEAVFSTATQFGGNSSLIERALAGRNVASMGDADIVSAIQDYKIANNESLFKSSSSAVRASTLNRASAEKATLLSLAGGVASPAAAAISRAPMAAAVVAAGAPPTLEMSGPTRLNSAAPAAGAPPVAAPGQDVRDRTIAHIVTGGIGGGSPYR